MKISCSAGVIAGPDPGKRCVKNQSFFINGAKRSSPLLASSWPKGQNRGASSEKLKITENNLFFFLKMEKKHATVATLTACDEESEFEIDFSIRKVYD